MTDSNWSKNLKDIPEISHEYIDNWAEKDEKIPKAKQHKGYSNFVEGYVLTWVMTGQIQMGRPLPTVKQAQYCTPHCTLYAKDFFTSGNHAAVKVYTYTKPHGCVEGLKLQLHSQNQGCIQGMSTILQTQQRE